VIAFDIDGVLADARHREHHLARRPKDWEAFFAEAALDEPIAAGRQALADACEGGTVVLISGRPERLRQATMTWLARHGFPPVQLYLRRDTDHRPAAVVKSEILAALGGPLQVSKVHDDDPAVVAALQSLGYQAILVEPLPSIS
jgi:hypothetical protein